LYRHGTELSTPTTFAADFQAALYVTSSALRLNPSFRGKESAPNHLSNSTVISKTNHVIFTYALWLS